MNEILKSCQTMTGEIRKRLNEIDAALSDCQSIGDPPVTIAEAARLLCQLEDLHGGAEAIAERTCFEIESGLPMTLVHSEE